MSSSSDDEKKAQPNRPAASDQVGKALELPTDEADALPKEALDPVYAAKAEVLNRAIQDIGFGRYQVSCPQPVRRCS